MIIEELYTVRIEYGKCNALQLMPMNPYKQISTICELSAEMGYSSSKWAGGCRTISGKLHQKNTR